MKPLKIKLLTPNSAQKLSYQIKDIGLHLLKIPVLHYEDLLSISWLEDLSDHLIYFIVELMQTKYN